MGDIALFGVYGYPEHFLKSKFGKKRENIFSWLNSLGLHAFLLDWTYGTAMNEKRAKKYRILAKENKIKLVLRAPKDINFIKSKKTWDYSKKQLKRACNLALKLDCMDIIVNLGNNKVLEDRCALEKRLVELMQEMTGLYPTIRFHIEPAMRQSEWGSLDEVIALCKEIKNCYPSFNLMRLHAYSGCTLIYPEKIIALLRKIEKELGRETFEHFCVTICPLSYEHGRFIPKTFGEMKTGQLSFFDSNFEYFPKASDYIKAIRKLSINPITFSATPKTEEIGAMRLRDSLYFQKVTEREKNVE